MGTGVDLLLLGFCLFLLGMTVFLRSAWLYIIVMVAWTGLLVTNMSSVNNWIEIAEALVILWQVVRLFDERAWQSN